MITEAAILIVGAHGPDRCGNFKGVNEIDTLKGHVKAEANRYVDDMRKQGLPFLILPIRV